MKHVKISTKKPPQWILDSVKEKWGVKWENGTIFTYGDQISNCEGSMTEDLMHHEPYHTKQQEKFGSVDGWWKKYLEDDEFRFEQELECYRKQYQWVKQNIQDRNEVFSQLMHYARSLSGPIYGNLCSMSEALDKIQK